MSSAILPHPYPASTPSVPITWRLHAKSPISDSSSDPSSSSIPSEQPHDQDFALDPEQYDPYNPYSYAGHNGHLSEDDGQVNPYDLPPDSMLGYDAGGMDPYYPTPLPFTRQPVSTSSSSFLGNGTVHPHPSCTRTRAPTGTGVDAGCYGLCGWCTRPRVLRVATGIKWLVM